ncbi:hypothetical protein [Streptomyces natalensis]|uniref:hypothetical protein n=1 Tax=Streptomyces natalensis TaxID=68242 RepID=UPI0012FF0CA4|nr:hypothetical protein [Streptomyces natalensis]
MLGTTAAASPVEAADSPERTVAAPMAPPCPGGPAGDYCRSGDQKDKPATGEGKDKDKKDDPCQLLSGTPAAEYCKSDKGDGAAPKKPGGLMDNNPLDPLQSVADGCTKAASWIVTKLSYAVSATSTVDFTNAAFLRQYAIVFAASTVLTLILWLVGIMKRAIRGAKLTTAVGEAVGLLWLVVLASAFTPLMLYTVVGAVDAVTSVIADKGASDNFFGGFAKALQSDSGIGGGPIMQIVVAIVSIAAAGILWLEMAIRAAVLYVGAVLGTAVYSGFVDKDLWPRIKRWAGLMGAVIMVKPVVAIVLLLASALSGTKQDENASLSAVISGLAIIILAILASAVIYRFIPGLGDDIQASRRAIITQASPRNRVPQHTSPARTVQQGISTHSERGIGQQTSSSRPSAATTGQASGGIAAHSSRASRSSGTQGRQQPESRQQPGNDRPER